MKTYLQKKGETIYMPNIVYHSVWDLSPTLSVGNNPLFESSFVEQFGSGRDHELGGLHITEKLTGLGLEHLENVRIQIDKEIMQNNIPTYKPPKLTTGYDSYCLTEKSYDLKSLKKDLRKKQLKKIKKAK